MSVININKDNFAEKVLQEEKPVIVDFWAEWCGPCKMIAPFLDEIAHELDDTVSMVKVNIDSEPELAAQYGVLSIPTLLVFKGGKVKETKIGGLPKGALTEWIRKAIA